MVDVLVVRTYPLRQYIYIYSDNIFIHMVSIGHMSYTGISPEG